jgi:outer membrane protein assembly factor BamD
VLKTYPQAPAVEEALAILVVSYREMKLTDLSSDAQRVLALNFPNSKYAQGVDTTGKAWYRFW